MYFRLLRHNRDFRLLYAGTLISLGGDWFLTVALLDLVLSLTGSATLASLMLLCQSLPIFIVTPLVPMVTSKPRVVEEMTAFTPFSFFMATAVRPPPIVIPALAAL